ncbi:MAG: PQQ-dependent sugar dehydrogenase, partial [Anaerolineae bacterium]|nr:PQQ-dependent sugar dehydrogenase [Anaerolineae bacterium]
LSPLNDTRISAESVILEWQWVRPLEADEMYDVLVWTPGEEPCTMMLTDTSLYDLTEWLNINRIPRFTWTVRVRDTNGEIMTDSAPYAVVDVEMLPAPTATPMPGYLDGLISDMPPGFVANLYATTKLHTVTVITFGPDGYLYALGQGGDIWRLRDEDGDHEAEAYDVVFSDSNGEIDHAVGMAFAPDGSDTLYLSHKGQISRLDDSDGDGIYDQRTVIISGLPALLYTLHSNNGIAFGPDGKLYIAVGSTSDHGPLREPLESSILRANADGSDLEVFATGFRNPYDLVFSPEGDLFTADNSPDQMDSTLRYLPPEELDHVREGRDYGFPRVYGNLGAPDDPSERPITEFYTSAASAGIAYYDAEQFPPEYRHGVYVAQFGSGAQTLQDRLQRNGFSVVFVPLTATEDGTYSGDFQTFIQFERLSDTIPVTRPVDVTVGPDGALYISEATRGEIYRVIYAP